MACELVREYVCVRTREGRELQGMGAEGQRGLRGDTSGEGQTHACVRVAARMITRVCGPYGLACVCARAADVHARTCAHSLAAEDAITSGGELRDMYVLRRRTQLQESCAELLSQATSPKSVSAQAQG